MDKIQRPLPWRVQRKKSNNDDKHDHGPEKRRPSTDIEGMINMLNMLKTNKENIIKQNDNIQLDSRYSRDFKSIQIDNNSKMLLVYKVWQN